MTNPRHCEECGAPIKDNNRSGICNGCWFVENDEETNLEDLWFSILSPYEPHELN